MKLQAALNVLWLILLLLFLGGTVARLSERLKSKTVEYVLNPPQASLISQDSNSPVTRVNAMLGGVCILLATVWGFDMLLGWWMYAPSE